MPDRDLASSKQTAISQSLLQQWLHAGADVLIGVTYPADFSIEIQRCAEGKSSFIRDQYTGFAGNQFGGEIIGVAAQTALQVAVVQQGTKKGPQVSLKSVMSHHQFVELAARRKVLVFKRLGFDSSEHYQKPTSQAGVF